VLRHTENNSPNDPRATGGFMTKTVLHIQTAVGSFLGLEAGC